ncbi:hypothetical protein DM01DRAFT_1177622 [Hesseltinella vesiculosa]|uniref:Uncharacterized protein n=1 Tax=Hesseltinella vesiculosa TaxID=101127 RepID=A0A1X2G4P5_9FUNG|nr:hypothetical protein DM01DRAFT_1177622 [Hesseltinella vesiculosa]
MPPSAIALADKSEPCSHVSSAAYQRKPRNLARLHLTKVPGPGSPNCWTCPRWWRMTPMENWKVWAMILVKVPQAFLKKSKTISFQNSHGLASSSRSRPTTATSQQFPGFSSAKTTFEKMKQQPTPTDVSATTAESATTESATTLASAQATISKRRKVADKPFNACLRQGIIDTYGSKSQFSLDEVITNVGRRVQDASITKSEKEIKRAVKTSLDRMIEEDTLAMTKRGKTTLYFVPDE